MSDNLQDIPRDNAEERERLGRDPEHTRNILLGAVKEYYEGASSEVSEAVPTGGERIPGPADNAECGGPCDACGGDCMRTGPHEDCVCVEHVVCSNLGVSDHTADMRPCARCEAIVCSAHRYIVSGIPGHGLCEDCTKDPSIIERHRAVEEVSTPDVPLGAGTFWPGTIRDVRTGIEMPWDEQRPETMLETLTKADNTERRD